MGAAPVSQTRSVSHRSGLTPSEIARLPVRRFTGPSLTPSSPENFPFVKDLSSGCSADSSRLTTGIGSSCSDLEMAPESEISFGARDPTVELIASGVKSNVETPSEELEKKLRGRRLAKVVDSGRSTDETCAICLSKYERDCLLRILVPCGHVLHAR